MRPELFQFIARFAEDGILVCDEQYRIEYANRTASEITGRSNTDLLNTSLMSFTRQTELPLFDRLGTQPHGNDRPVCLETCLFTSSHGVKEVEVRLVPAQSDEGAPKIIVYLRDLTARKKYERNLKDSEEKLRSLLERVRHGVFLCSEEGKLLDCNQALLDMLGYSTKDEFLRIDISRDLYVGPEDRKHFQERVARDGCIKDVEVEFKKKNGEHVTVLLTGYPLRNEKGEIVGYEGISLDISERKRIENELREANEFFKNLIESSVDGIIAADMKGNIFIFNKGAETLTGHRAEEVLGRKNIREIYPEGVAREVMKKLRSPDHGGVGKLTPIQLNVLDKHGKEIPIQISAALIYDGAGKEIASVGIFTDLRPRITIEKKLEETYLQLVSSEKMASLGKLAAGIAHEINNPLGGILIYASLIMEDLGEGDPRWQDLSRIVQEASRCKDIVKSLLEFARQTEPKMEPTDINRAITDVLFFLENQALFHNIHIIKRLDPALPSPHANAGQLKQVFMNIIVNAAEAMNGSGTLTIATSVVPSRKSISVEFTDTGEGIPEENLTRIFDPFFTTKDVGKGTGLGLATSYGIIESHGGKIAVKSKVGQGSTFTIELPVHPAKQTFLENRSVTNQGVKDEFKHADGSEGKPLSL
jgi:two-component system NtrC family sensor kinase